MFQDHIINKCAVRFIAGHGVNKELIHNNLANEKDNIIKVVGDIFSEYFPGNSWIDIDRIHLDLGTLSPSDFPGVYKSRIKKLLIPEIEKLLKKESFQEQLQRSLKKASEDRFLLFENYLENGFNPVLQKDKSFSPDTFLLSLMEEDRNRLIVLVEKGLKHEKIRKRLHRLDQETLQKLIAILPGEAQKELIKNEISRGNNQSVEIIIHYFLTGVFLGRATVLSPFDIDFLAEQLTSHDKRKLAVALLTNLSAPSFLHRVSGSLRFETVYSCLKTLESQAARLEEWDFIHSSFFREEYCPAFSSYRLLFLGVMKYPFEAYQEKAELIYKHFIQNRYAIKGLEDLLTFFHTIKEEKIPDSRLYLLEYLERKFSDSIPEKESRQPAENSDLWITYFQTGELEQYEDISLMVKKQLDTNSLSFINSIQRVWKEEGARYRMAYSLDLELLRKLTENLGRDHYTYGWWIDSIRKVTLLPGDTISLVRHAHFLYYDLLSKSDSLQWTKDQFEEWFVANLKYLLPVENKKPPLSTHTEDGAFVKKYKPLSHFENILIDFSKERALQYKISELAVLSKKGSVEDVQLFFEYYLEVQGFLAEQYFKIGLPYTQWTQIWISVPNHQLERILAVIAYSHYQFMMELLEEFRLFWVLNSYTASFELIRRKVFLLTLQILYETKGKVDPEILSLRIIPAVLEDNLVTLSVLENEKRIPAERMPKITFVIEKKEQEKQAYEKKSILYFQSFKKVIEQRFSDVSGFVLVYFTSARQFFIDRKIFSESIQERLFLYVYDYLQKHRNNFSAASFVREINRQVALLSQLMVQEVNEYFLSHSEKGIQQGNSVFFVMKEVVRSLQKEESTLPAEVDTYTTLEDTSYEEEQIKRKFQEESHRLQIEFIQRSIIDYLIHGKLPDEEESGFESEDHFRTFITDFAIKHSALLFQWAKELFSEEGVLDSFLNMQRVEIQNFILKILAENRHEEFSAWMRDVESFILVVYPEVDQKKAALIVRKSVMLLLLGFERSTVGIFSYLELIVKISWQQNITIVNPDFSEVVKKYEQEKKGTPFLIGVLLKLPSILLTKDSDHAEGVVTGADPGKSMTKRGEDDRRIESFFLLPEQSSIEDIRLYFEYYLEEEESFREMLRIRSVPLQFWMHLSELLPISLLERLLVVMLRPKYVHFKQVLNELKSLRSFEGGVYGVEQPARREYALVFHTIHESGYLNGKEEDRVELEFLAAFFSREYQLRTSLESRVEKDRKHIFENFPRLYRFLQKNRTDLRSIDDRGEVSMEEIQKRINTYAPETLEFATTFLSVLEEYFSAYLAHLPKAAIGLYREVYYYLQRNQKDFSPHSFVQDIMAQLAQIHSLYLREIGNAVLKIAERYVEEENTRYWRLKEVLFLQGYRVEGLPVDDRPTGTYSSSGKKYNFYDSKETFSSGTSEQFENYYNSFPASVISFSEFKQLLEERFPEVSGFISTYLLTLEQSSLGSLLHQKDLCVAIYNYLLQISNSNTSFSSVSFVREINTYISVRHTLDRREIERILIDFSEEKNEQGFPRFSVLTEIVHAQKSESKELTISSVSAVISEEHDIRTKELEDYCRKVQLDSFRKILTAYINEGVFPELETASSDSVKDGRLYLRKIFSEHKGHLLFIIRELLSKESSLESFLKRTDIEIGENVLRELSGKRYDEFVEWTIEIEKFLLWARPELDKVFLAFNVRLSLFRLLVTKNSISVGLFSYLESVVENLKLQQIIIITEKFPSLLKQYKKEGKGNHVLLVKALERLEYLLAGKERELFLEELITRKNKEKKKDITIEGRLLIHNAGLVLSGPFLYRYFDRLGMLEEQKFKTEEQSYRAVQLLQFLATGTTEMQEHELVLNKILCGVKLDFPVESSFTITAEEQEVSESLLGGMMANWDKLKSNSIEALREIFMRKQGYLEQTESGWSLEVERNATDILVDFIPWSFSVIKLSWMEHSLTTKWKKSIVEY